MNNVALVGRLTRDVEKRVTNTQDSVASFNLAVNRNYNSADGVQADFIPCGVWGKLADNVDKYCSKGSQVAIEGRLRTRTYEDNNRIKRFVMEVVCSSVQFLDTKKEQHPNVNHDDLYKESTNDPFEEFGDIQF